MSKDTKKEEKKPAEIKKPEIIEIERKTVAYKRGEKDPVSRKGDKDDRRK